MPNALETENNGIKMVRLQWMGPRRDQKMPKYSSSQATVLRLYGT